MSSGYAERANHSIRIVLSEDVTSDQYDILLAAVTFCPSPIIESAFFSRHYDRAVTEGEKSQISLPRLLVRYAK